MEDINHLKTMLRAQTLTNAKAAVSAKTAETFKKKFNRSR
jgi:hypothetical protein